MIAPHLNPAVDAHTRFRLALQVSNVKRLVDSPHAVWRLAYSPDDVRRMRTDYGYGWQVAGTTVDSLFRKHGVPWDDEDEAKAAGERATSWDQRAFWREWSRPEPPVVMVVPDLLPADLRALILSFVPPEPKPSTTSSSSPCRGGSTPARTGSSLTLVKDVRADVPADPETRPAPPPVADRAGPRHANARPARLHMLARQPLRRGAALGPARAPVVVRHA